MKLNSNFKCVVASTDTTGKCKELEIKLPSQDCLKQPNVLVVEYDGVYYILKSRWELKGEPNSQEELACDLYGLEFMRHSLNAVKVNVKRHAEITGSFGMSNTFNSFSGLNILITLN